MAKFHGNIGYIILEETSPGVYSAAVTEKPCRGDILRNSQRWEQTDKVNSDFNINNRFSVITDSFLNEHLSHVRYIEWNGVKWNVSSIDIQRPRIILNIGGIYNGQ